METADLEFSHGDWSRACCWVGRLSHCVVFGDACPFGALRVWRFDTWGSLGLMFLMCVCVELCLPPCPSPVLHVGTGREEEGWAMVRMDWENLALLLFFLVLGLDQLSGARSCMSRVPGVLDNGSQQWVGRQKSRHQNVFFVCHATWHLGFVELCSNILFLWTKTPTH